MAAHSAEELLPMLLGTDLFTNLFEDRLNLQQRTLLAYPGMIAALSRHLGLPPSDNLEQFRKDYNRKYYTKSCSHYLSSYQCFVKAAEYGELATVKSYVERNLVQYLWEGTIASAKNNKSEVVDYLLTRDPRNLDIAIKASIEGNHLELFNRLIAQRLEVDRAYLLGLLSTAGAVNATTIVPRLIELIDQPEDEDVREKLNEVRFNLLVHARDLEGLKLLLANTVFLDLYTVVDLGLYIAGKKNYLEIIDYLLSIVSTWDSLSSPIAMEQLIQGAIEGGHFDLYDRYYVPEDDTNIKFGLDKLVEQNRRDLIDILLSKNPNLLDAGLESAVTHNNRELLQHFLNVRNIPLGGQVLSNLVMIAGTREDTQDLVPFFNQQLDELYQSKGFVEFPAPEFQDGVEIPGPDWDGIFNQANNSEDDTIWDLGAEEQDPEEDWPSSEDEGSWSSSEETE